MPLGVDRFALGEGPFRVRGLAYVAALAYVDRRLPGGRAALDAALEGDPLRGYLDQIFVPPGNYDVSPLLALYRAAAKLEGLSVRRFIEERSRASAVHDAKGIYKPLLASVSVRPMAERLPLVYNRYFEPSQARALGIEAQRFEGELSKLPETMNGLYCASTVGFVSGALELAGARSVRLEWTAPVREGALCGVATCRVRFVARWE